LIRISENEIIDLKEKLQLAENSLKEKVSLHKISEEIVELHERDLENLRSVSVKREKKFVLIYLILKFDYFFF
jgi:hypothetical protein